MNPEEQALVKRALRGDPDAINEIVDRYSAFVNRVASGVVKNSADAADVTQEVLLKVVSSISSLEVVEGFQSWLYKIAYRTSLNWLRSRKKIPLREDAELDQLPAADLSSDLELEREEDITRLTAAMSEMPYPYLLVLKLFYFDNHSIREIAEKLGVTEGAVKIQLHRARRMLRDKLQPQKIRDA